MAETTELDPRLQQQEEEDEAWAHEEAGDDDEDGGPPERPEVDYERIRRWVIQRDGKDFIQYLGDQDSTTRRLMEEILAKEAEHADELADLLQVVPPSHAQSLSQRSSAQRQPSAHSP